MKKILFLLFLTKLFSEMICERFEKLDLRIHQYEPITYLGFPIKFILKQTSKGFCEILQDESLKCVDILKSSQDVILDVFVDKGILFEREIIEKPIELLQSYLYYLQRSLIISSYKKYEILNKKFPSFFSLISQNIKES